MVYALLVDGRDAEGRRVLDDALYMPAGADEVLRRLNVGRAAS